MSTHDKATSDNTYPSRPAAQQKQGSSITDKIGGAVDVIHGTGDVIRGHAMDAVDFGHGNGKAIVAAGRDEVQRGLNKIEGRPTATSATGGHAPDYLGGVDGGTGAAPSLDPNTPQYSTSAPRADPTTEKVRGYTADTGYPADKSTASATANSALGRTSEQQQFSATVSPRDRPTQGPTAADDPSVQRDIDVRQQGASSDRDKGNRTTADASYPANAAGQEQPSRTALQA